MDKGRPGVRCGGNSMIRSRSALKAWIWAFEVSRWKFMVGEMVNQDPRSLACLGQPAGEFRSCVPRSVCSCRRRAQMHSRIEHLCGCGAQTTWCAFRSPRSSWSATSASFQRPSSATRPRRLAQVASLGTARPRAVRTQRFGLDLSGTWKEGVCRKGGVRPGRTWTRYLKACLE